MKIYVVIEDIDDYYDCGGGAYPDAVFSIMPTQRDT